MARVAFTIGREKYAASYRRALETHFADVEMLLPGDERHATDFDGLVLAGGSDVNAKLYGEPPAPEAEAPDAARDEMETRLIAEALAADMPLFAICRGIQMLNVAMGGGLVQHLPTTDVHRQKGVDEAHEAEVVAGTRLAQIIGAGHLAVNSRHHQAVAPARMGRGLVIAASRPEDGVVEAAEMPGYRFVLGVQWHPEDRAASVEADGRLFAAFADAVR